VGSVPNACKEQIRGQLERIGINEFSVYHTLDRLASDVTIGFPDTGCLISDRSKSSAENHDSRCRAIFIYDRRNTRSAPFFAELRQLDRLGSGSAGGSGQKSLGSRAQSAKGASGQFQPLAMQAKVPRKRSLR